MTEHCTTQQHTLLLCLSSNSKHLQSVIFSECELTDGTFQINLQWVTDMPYARPKTVRIGTFHFQTRMLPTLTLVFVLCTVCYQPNTTQLLHLPAIARCIRLQAPTSVTTWLAGSFVTLTPHHNGYLWQPCIADADITFLPCSLFYLLFFPRLISAVADWMSTVLPHVVALMRI